MSGSPTPTRASRPQGGEPAVARVACASTAARTRTGPGPHLSLPEEVQFLIALRSRLHVHSHASEEPDSSRKPRPPPRRNLKRLKPPNSYFRSLDAHRLLALPTFPQWAGPVLRKLNWALGCALRPLPRALRGRKRRVIDGCQFVDVDFVFASKDRSAF